MAGLARRQQPVQGCSPDLSPLAAGCILVLSRNFVQYACFGLFGIIALQVSGLPPLSLLRAEPLGQRP